jgi:hypothetical protein
MITVDNSVLVFEESLNRTEAFTKISRSDIQFEDSEEIGSGGLYAPKYDIFSFRQC